jgi:hypothetical protein
MGVMVAQPARGGYMTGLVEMSSQPAAFEFAPGSAPTGTLVVVQLTQVTGPQGDQRDAYRIVVSTSVSSVSSHSRTATATGTASVAIYDAVTGVHYTQFDQTTQYQVNVAPDGSVVINTSSFTETLPAGSGINHL